LSWAPGTQRSGFPRVDSAFGFRRWRESGLYIPTQVVGCTLGTILANVMFALRFLYREVRAEELAEHEDGAMEAQTT
jgi:hypothetical protein